MEGIQPWPRTVRAGLQLDAQCLRNTHRRPDFLRLVDLPAQQHRPGAHPRRRADRRHHARSEEHTSELQSLMRTSYAVFCMTKKKNKNSKDHNIYNTHMTNTY